MPRPQSLVKNAYQGLLGSMLLALPLLAADRPNIVFILADDLGYGDVHALNPDSKIPTPNLDRLATEGIRFTDAHTPSSVCTPTRYGLLTGRYCWRSRLKRGVLFPPNDQPLIETDRTTLASMLKDRGYYTGCIGKWHLGIGWARDTQGKVDFNQPFEHGPTDLGFDEFFGIAASLDMIPYTYLRSRGALDPVVETQPALRFPRYIRKGPKASGFDPGKVLDELVRRAVDFVRQRSAKAEPFFLYFPLTAPHKPVWPAPRFVGKTALGPYGDFVHQVDWAVGQMLQTLETLGLAEQTLVFFTSDNGSFMYRRKAGEAHHLADPSNQGFRPEDHTANGPWRGTKADIWEAGHRVPFFVRWPGKIKPGSDSKRTIGLTDVMATLAEITGYSLGPQEGGDSYSFLPILLGNDATYDRPPVIHHSANGMFAIRDGPWKLVLGNGSGGRERPVGKPFARPYTLYNLETDPGENRDIAAEHPDLVQRLSQRVETIRTQSN